MTKCIGEYLVVAFHLKGVFRIYQVDDLNERLINIFEVKYVTEQLPFLPNQIDNNRHLDLVNRSVTDLSVPLEGDYHIQEINKEQMYVKELHIKQFSQNHVVLVLSLSNGKILVYENIETFQNIKKERFRFKLVQSQVLRKAIKNWGQ